MEINDEALDTLDKSDDETRTKFFSGLTDEERGQLAAAIPTWKAKKATPPAAPPSPQAAASPQTQEPIDPYAIAGAGTPSSYTSPLESLNQIKDAGANWFQQYIGGPLATAYQGVAGFDAQNPLPGGASLANMPESLLIRQALSPIAGQQNVEPSAAFSEGARAQAVNSLEGALGPTGAAVAQFGATQIPTLPLMLGGEAIPEAPTLSGVMKYVAGAGKGAAKGAAVGTAQAAITPGQPLEEGAVIGGLLGAGGGLLGTFLKSMNPKVQEQLGREVAALPDSHPAVEVAKAPPEAPVGVTGVTKTAEGYANPSGALFARVFGIGEDGRKVILHDIPIDTEAQAAQFANWVKDNPGVPKNFTREFLDATNDKSRQWQWNAFGMQGETPDPELMLNTPEKPGLRFPGKTGADSPKALINGGPSDSPPPAILPVQQEPTYGWNWNTGKPIISQADIPEAPEPLPEGIKPRWRHPISGAKVDVPSPTNSVYPTRDANPIGPAPTPPPPQLPPPPPNQLAAPDPAPPPPPPPPGTLPPAIINRSAQVNLILRAWQQRGSDAVNKMLNYVMGKGLRGPSDLAGFVQNTLAARALEETGIDNMKAMRAVLKSNGVLMNAFDRDVEQVGLGRMTTNELWQRHPDAQPVARQLFQNQLAERDTLDLRISQLGGTPENLVDLRDAGMIDKYMTRMYLSRILGPGVWAKQVMKMPDLMNTAIQDIAGRAPQYTPEEIAGELHNLIRGPNPFAAAQNSQMMKTAFSAKLRSLNDLSQPVRDVMGEVHSGMYRLASSLGAQRANVANLTLMEELVGNSNWSSDTPRIDLHPEALPNNPRLYGKAAGLYVKPEIYDAVVNIPKALDQMPSIWRSLYQFQKKNLIGWNPGTVLKNGIEDVWHSVLAGGLDPFRPVESGQSMVTAMNALREYAANPSATTDGAALIREMKANGAIKLGWNQAELNTTHKQFLNYLNDAVEAHGGTLDFWNMSGLMRSVGAKYNSFIGKSSEIQDAITHLFRAANYVSLTNRFTALPGEAPLREALRMVGPSGMAREEAGRLASLRINQSFQDPTNLGSAISRTRGVPVFGPFFPSVADEVRVWGHAMARMNPMSPNFEPDLAWRVGSLALFLGGMFGAGGYARHAAGITDDEVEKAQAEVTKRTGAIRPALAAAPWRDPRTGLPQLYDMTPFSSALQLFQGHPDDAMWRRVLANVLTFPVQGGLQEGMMRQALESSGVVRPTDPPGAAPKLLEGEAGLLEGLKRMNQLGLAGPAVLGKAARAADRMTPAAIPQPAPWSASQAAQSVAGIPIVSPSTPLASRQELVGELQNMNKEMLQAYRSGKPELLPAIKARVQELAKQLQEKSAIINKEK